jgi:hypothetical protein
MLDRLAQSRLDAVQQVRARGSFGAEIGLKAAACQ